MKRAAPPPAIPPIAPVESALFDVALVVEPELDPEPELEPKLGTFDAPAGLTEILSLDEEEGYKTGGTGSSGAGDWTTGGGEGASGDGLGLAGSCGRGVGVGVEAGRGVEQVARLLESNAQVDPVGQQMSLLEHLNVPG